MAYFAEFQRQIVIHGVFQGFVTTRRAVPVAFAKHPESGADHGRQQMFAGELPFAGFPEGLTRAIGLHQSAVCKADVAGIQQGGHGGDGGGLEDVIRIQLPDIHAAACGDRLVGRGGDTAMRL